MLLLVHPTFIYKFLYWERNYRKSVLYHVSEDKGQLCWDSRVGVEIIEGKREYYVTSLIFHVLSIPQVSGHLFSYCLSIPLISASTILNRTTKIIINITD